MTASPPLNIHSLPFCAKCLSGKPGKDPKPTTSATTGPSPCLFLRSAQKQGHKPPSLARLVIVNLGSNPLVSYISHSSFESSLSCIFYRHSSFRLEVVLKFSQPDIFHRHPAPLLALLTVLIITQQNVEKN